jgi:hypothetical protein
LKLKKKKGWCFGESRGKMQTGGIFEKHLLGIPGYNLSIIFIIFRPGTYREKSQLSDI